MSAVRARYVLIFDGGSIGNPGEAYGSFRLQRSGSPPLPVQRLKFGRGTNNEAEYKALLGGLEELRRVLAGEGHRPADVEIEVRGDSRLVLEQLRGDVAGQEPAAGRVAPSGRRTAGGLRARAPCSSGPLALGPHPRPLTR